MAKLKITPTLAEHLGVSEEVISTQGEYVTFYKVANPDGVMIWGGCDSGEAIFWLTRKAPAGSRLTVAIYDEDGEDAWLVGKEIDITPVVANALGRDW